VLGLQFPEHVHISSAPTCASSSDTIPVHAHTPNLLPLTFDTHRMFATLPPLPPTTCSPADRQEPQ
jgi:hypothetical protein